MQDLSGGSKAMRIFSETRSAASLTPVVFVVDDDVSVRESVQALLETAGWETRTFDSASAFLAHSASASPCCLVLDVGLPDLNGLDLQDRVAGERNSMPIIFITGYGDVPTTVRAMKAGAIEFLTKPINADALLNAVADAIDKSRAVLGLEQETEALRNRYETLTSRAREVMALVVSGLLNKQVGAELGISEITVKAHRGRVMVKMEAGSLAELVMMNSRLRPSS